MKNDYSYSYELPENYPEKKNEKASSEERIKRATEMFEEHFGKDGKPITAKGYILARKYNDPPEFDLEKLRVL